MAQRMIGTNYQNGDRTYVQTEPNGTIRSTNISNGVWNQPALPAVALPGGALTLVMGLQYVGAYRTWSVVYYNTGANPLTDAYVEGSLDGVNWYPLRANQDAEEVITRTLAGGAQGIVCHLHANAYHRYIRGQANSVAATTIIPQVSAMI